MCGRIVSSSAPADLARYFAAELPVAPTGGDGAPDSPALGARYNVAPTAELYVVRQRETGRRLERFRWGLVPPWSKDTSGAARLINARAETVATKKSFRAAFEQRRCLVPADGFYEWTTVAGHKKRQPWYVHAPGGEPYAFAGLWERWHTPALGDGPGAWLRTCCIITAPANDKMARLHDRMPVVLPPAMWEQWLDPTERDPARIAPLLRPTPADLVEFHPVSVQVNSANNEGPQLIAPVEHIDPDGLGQLTMLLEQAPPTPHPADLDGPLA